ncbi:MAG: hypothetical protein NTY32_01235, partial [Bacteroidia bacterium]|nr:hypothetical protein [Bacteroidia bacterium]
MGATNPEDQMMKYRKGVMLIILFLQFVLCSSKEQNVGKELDRVLNISMQQALDMYHVIKDQAGKLPRSANTEGELVCSNDKWWTSGFFPGTLWYLYHYAPSESLRGYAETITRRVIGQQYTTDNHDVGFMIYCSFGNGYKQTQNEEYKKVILNAARSLSTRFNPM